jgi:hypothetical protein
MTAIPRKSSRRPKPSLRQRPDAANPPRAVSPRPRVSRMAHAAAEKRLAC